MRERGSALLTAVISVTVLLLISGIFFSLVNDQMKSNSYEEKAIKSYYLAQAGIFYGIAMIKADNVPAPDLITGISEDPVLNPFGFGYGGKYNVEWQMSEDEEFYTISSTGSYGSGTGQVERTLKAYYKIGGAGGTEGEGEIITQALINENEVGQGNTSFVFCNVNPLNDTLPVKFSEPIFIYTINNGGHTISGNSEASNVRVSLRNSSDQTLELTTSLERDMTQPTEYLYIVPNFQGVSAEPFTVEYQGNEMVHLVVEGYITRNGHTPDYRDETGTVTNNFLASPDSGLIWQVEN